jgi:hypothetical protein
MVMTHGYGSGSGLWLFNLDELAKHYKVRIILAIRGAQRISSYPSRALRDVCPSPTCAARRVPLVARVPGRADLLR